MATPDSGAPPLADVLDHNSRYKPINWLGSGSFGNVVLAEDAKTNKQVAIKLLPRGHKIDENVRREIQNHMQLRHPHVIEFKRAFLTRKYLAIVMEFAPRGSMYEYVTKRRYSDGAREQGRLREDEARWYFQQLVIAVDYLHKSGVAARDIKLENALLGGNALAPDRLPLKLCDFGYSKSVLDSVPTSRVGTVSYMAPEIVLCKPGQSYDAYRADLWSVGCFLYVMLTGAYPFVRVGDFTLPPHEQQIAIMRRTVAAQYAMAPPLQSASPEVRDLLSKLFMVDPGARIGLGQIMRHPWFVKGLPAGVEGILASSGPGTQITGQSCDEVDRIVQLARTREDADDDPGAADAASFMF